ncbi:MAG: Ig-like domain-containing protein [Methanobrevibacter sp.]|nr:Ig-like domain-containing protein [Methanobrevibacter sp.]
MNKKILTAILVVVIIGAGAYGIHHFAGGKLNTQINFIGEKTLQNGEQIQFELKDAQGNALAGQTVNITFGDEKYQVTTDENGKGYLTVDGEEAGSYEVTVDYGGNDKYNGCTGKITLTVTDGEADNPASETNNEATANTNGNGKTSGLHYDSKYGVYYDDNGKVHMDGQYDGMNIDDYRRFIDNPRKFMEELENITDDNN